MTTIYPVPTGRTSGLLAQTRLLNQLQGDYSELLKLQTQVSTGRRIQLPSEDAPAAQRAIILQRLLEQKDQAKINLNTTRSYTDASDASISRVTDLLIGAKSSALGAASNTISATERQTAANELRDAADQLVEIGNQRFRDRYLFGGSRTTTPPFEKTAQFVSYNGNEGRLRSYADLGLLYEASKSGTDVFGTYSPDVRGSADLNPILTAETPLADLRGGAGITRGSISVSDGTNTTTIDISVAETIGDVAALLENNPPAGRVLKARVTSLGLELQLDTAGGGNLIVREVANGTTAAELGILQTTPAGTGPFAGDDLDPVAQLTTRLQDILGARAVTVVRSDGTDNDIRLEARTVGTAANGVTVQFVDDSLLHASSGLPAGGETVQYSSAAVGSRAALTFTGFGNNLILTATTPGTDFNNVEVEVVNAGAIGNAATVSYNSTTKKLSIGIDSTGATQVQSIIDALATDGSFTAAYDSSDPVDGGFSATATIAAADAGVVRGNTGNSGGAANTIFVNIDPGFTTANQVVTALRANSAVNAQFSVELDATDSSLAINAGLAPVAVNATGTTAEGRGVVLDQTSGLRVVNGGVTHLIDISSASTIEDLLNLLNGSEANVSAAINAAGTGIDIRSRLSGSDFFIGENGGQTATQLGIRSLNSGTQLSSLNYGRGVNTTTGTDFTIHRRDGVDLAIDVSTATTIQDVLNLINNDANNLNPATRVTARLATTGNGIELVDSNTTGTDTLRVTKAFQSNAAIDLGLIPTGSTTAAGTLTGTDQILTGSDKNPLQVEGAFDTLLRLANAIENEDYAEMERLSASLDDDINRVNFARADLGQRSAALDTISLRLEDENIQLQDTLSQEVDVDIAEAISKLSARQASLEASLQLTGRTFQLSLLDYL